jgi:hypothetical protein
MTDKFHPSDHNKLQDAKSRTAMTNNYVGASETLAPSNSPRNEDPLYILEEEAKIPNKVQLAEDEDLVYGGNLKPRTRSKEQRREIKNKNLKKDALD